MTDHLFGAIAFATTMVIYANRYQVGIKIGKKVKDSDDISLLQWC